MDIRFFHKYNTLVRRGMTKPLTCVVCKNEFTLRVTEDMEPVLQCNFCLTKRLPGIAEYDRVKAVVKEHFV